jgi:hypothetical protein
LALLHSRSRKRIPPPGPSSLTGVPLSHRFLSFAVNFVPSGDESHLDFRGPFSRFLDDSNANLLPWGADLVEAEQCHHDIQQSLANPTLEFATLAMSFRFRADGSGRNLSRERNDDEEQIGNGEPIDDE